MRPNNFDDRVLQDIGDSQNQKVVLIQFNKKLDGPLLDMFESPMFTPHMLVTYLHKLNKPNLIEYLVNKLFAEHH